MTDFDGLTIAHLGDLSHVPTQQEIEQFGPIDVLLVPVGGGNALNSAQASEVISRIEPAGGRIVKFMGDAGLAVFEPAQAEKVVFALAPKRDPEVCALLAECLVAHAEELIPSDRAKADENLATAEKLMAVGREIAPTHAAMDRTREEIERVRASLNR